MAEPGRALARASDAANGIRRQREREGDEGGEGDVAVVIEHDVARSGRWGCPERKGKNSGMLDKRMPEICIKTADTFQAKIQDLTFDE